MRNSTEGWVEWCFDKVTTGGGVQRIVLWVFGWLRVFVGFFFGCLWCADRRWVYCPELFLSIWKCPLPQLFVCLWWWGAGVRGGWPEVPLFYWHLFEDGCPCTIWWSGWLCFDSPGWIGYLRGVRGWLCRLSIWGMMWWVRCWGSHWCRECTGKGSTHIPVEPRCWWWVQGMWLIFYQDKNLKLHILHLDIMEMLVICF